MSRPSNALKISHHQSEMPEWAKKYKDLKPVSENEFMLNDRLTKIKSVISKYGEDNFYIAFSGGKDSCTLSALVDMAIPGNTIPRVYCNTGIELNMMRDFVISLSEEDSRIHIIQPAVPIKQTLEQEGYPFKSKNHSMYLDRYRKNPEMESVQSYIGNGSWGPMLQCPKMLKFQFSKDYDLKISDKCCLKLKEEPLRKWSKENNRPISMIGLSRSEHGRRVHAVCTAFKKGKLTSFQPLVPVTKEWEDWFIKEYGIRISPLYDLGWERSGCKGCPFARDLQSELDRLEEYFPAERRQVELIWKPVYDEYRRLNYRLKKDAQEALSKCA